VLHSLLEDHSLSLVALSSGSLRPDAAGSLEEQLAPHLRHARFVRDVGGRFLQVTDERPQVREAAAADYRNLGLLLTELGRRTSGLGVTLVLHNHMGALSESPAEVARVMDATDSRYVKLLLDVAHYHQAGGKPDQAVRDFRDRLALLHLKDVESPVPGGRPGSFRFVELGRGSVDLSAVFAALRETGFDGWGMVELDAVTEPGRSARQATALSVEFLAREGVWDGKALKGQGAKGD
jgi:inosose dehydratase